MSGLNQVVQNAKISVTYSSITISSASDILFVHQEKAFVAAVVPPGFRNPWDASVFLLREDLRYLLLVRTVHICSIDISVSAIGRFPFCRFSVVLM